MRECEPKPGERWDQTVARALADAKMMHEAVTAGFAGCVVTVQRGDTLVGAQERMARAISERAGRGSLRPCG